MARKTWKEKFESKSEPEIRRPENAFADIPAGSTMLIATPGIIADYITSIPRGKHADVKKIRRDLAATYHAEYTCPVTTGIFLRIVAETAYEEHMAGKSLEEVTPFWRAIDKRSTAASKLSFGYEFVARQRALEGIA